MMGVSGVDGLMAIAWPSSMPSAWVSLCTMELRRWVRSDSRTRPSLRSSQVSPPSVVRIAPAISSAA